MIAFRFDQFFSQDSQALLVGSFGLSVQNSSAIPQPWHP
jgi:hypothetical protein